MRKPVYEFLRPLVLLMIGQITQRFEGLLNKKTVQLLQNMACTLQDQESAQCNTVPAKLWMLFIQSWHV